jgi:hypothetical protein
MFLMLLNKIFFVKSYIFKGLGLLGFLLSLGHSDWLILKITNAHSNVFN